VRCCVLLLFLLQFVDKAATIHSERFPIELSLSEVKLNGVHLFCGFVRDLTLRKQMREQMVRNELSEKTLSGIFDAATDALVVINVHGKIVRVNQACLHVFGYDNAEDLLGRNVRYVW
jgi:PAS domain-containing protein